MEQQYEEQQSSIFKFGFDETSKEHIKVISQWALINAILAFSGLAINIFQFIKLAGVSYRSSYLAGYTLGGNGVSLFFQVIISILLNVVLYNVSVQLKKGLETNNAGMLAKGFGSLRTYYKIYGILIIVI